MSVMETMFKSLVNSLGVSPEDMQQALKMVITELTTLQAERAAFKLGAGQMVAMFQARLNAQDAELADMKRLLIHHLGELPKPEPMQLTHQPVNGGYLNG